MAELVDALVSGTSVGNDVQVRALFRALIFNMLEMVKGEKFIPIAKQYREALFRALICNMLEMVKGEKFIPIAKRYRIALFQKTTAKKQAQVVKLVYTLL